MSRFPFNGVSRTLSDALSRHQAKIRLRFNDQDFAWRPDLGETIVVYQYGGSRLWVLRGGMRQRFLDIVESGSLDCGGLEGLLEVGVFTETFEV